LCAICRRGDDRAERQQYDHRAAVFGNESARNLRERRRRDHGFDLDIHDNRHGVNYNGVDDNRFGIDVRRWPNEHASGADFSQRHPAGR
jgi:hypothetical protein